MSNPRTPIYRRQPGDSTVTAAEIAAEKAKEKAIQEAYRKQHELDVQAYEMHGTLDPNEEGILNADIPEEEVMTTVVTSEESSEPETSIIEEPTLEDVTQFVETVESDVDVDPVFISQSAIDEESEDVVDEQPWTMDSFETVEETLASVPLEDSEEDTITPESDTPLIVPPMDDLLESTPVQTELDRTATVIDTTEDSTDVSDFIDPEDVLTVETVEDGSLAQSDDGEVAPEPIHIQTEAISLKTPPVSDEVSADEESTEESSLIVVPFNDEIDLLTDMREITKDMTRSEYDQASHSDPRLLSIQEESIFLNNHQRSNREAIVACVERGDKLSKNWKDPETGKTYGPSTLSKKYMAKTVKSGSVIDPKDVGVYIAAMTNGVKHVHLPNSGFSMHLRAPKNTELTVYHANAFRTIFEYGRLSGQYYFTTADLAIKKTLLELLPNWIVKCNLTNWRQNLYRNLMLPDYDVILWAIATLMHPNGVPITFSCRADNCPNPKTTVHTDIDQLMFFNRTATSLEAKRFLFNSADKSELQLEEYRKMLGFDVERKLFDGWYGSMQVPSMEEYIQSGEEYTADLISHIQTSDENGVMQYLSMSRNQAFVPWIKSIRYIDPETGVESGSIRDRSTLSETVAQLQTVDKGNDEFFENAKKYTEFVKLSHPGYPHSECPNCHTPIKNAVGGIIPCDMQSTFFQLSVMRLSSL